jgi:hypothetical protein
MSPEEARDFIVYLTNKH